MHPHTRKLSGAPWRRSPAERTAVPALPRAGQVSVVTGGSAGLGLAIGALPRAVPLGGRSASRCAQEAERLAAETGRPVLGHACDVTDEDAVTSLANICAKLGIAGVFRPIALGFWHLDS